MSLPLTTVTAGVCLDGIFEGRIQPFDPPWHMSPLDHLKVTINSRGQSAVYWGMRDLEDHLIFHSGRVLLVSEPETDPRERTTSVVEESPLAVSTAR